MLDSLQRRPRGRAVAPVLARLTGGAVPAGVPDVAMEEPPDEKTLEALRAYVVTEYDELLGTPSRELVERIDDEDVAEIRRRLDPDWVGAWDVAPPATSEHLKLVLGVHCGVESILEKTGLRTDEPPGHIHAMGRGPLAAGGDPWLADIVADAAERGGLELVDGTRVLDFGCSSGRHLRVLQAWRPGVRWTGCDPNADAIAWAEEHLPGIDFFVSPQDPPLPLEDASLDGAFAVSVWSHFGAGAAVAWLDEMQRLIRPGGVLVLTTQSFGSLAHYLRRGEVTDEYALTALRGLVATGHHYIEAFGEGGDWGVEHPQWGMAYMTLEWLAQRTMPGWTIALYEAVRVDTNQDLVVLRRR